MTGSKRQTEKNGERPAGGWRLAAVDTPQRAFVFLNPLVVLLLYTLLALVVTHPLWLHSADAVPGDIGDPLLNTWIIAWDAHATLTNPLQLFDANIFFPLPNTLAYSEHLYSTAALILPLGLVSGQPVLGYNLSLLLSFPLAGLGMYLLVLHWTHRHGAAFLAGLAYAFAPYRLAAIAHLQLLTIQWLPFSLLALDWILKSQTPHPRSHRAKYWPLFVIFTTLQVLASWYLAVFTVLVLGLYTLGWWVTHLRRRDGRATLSTLGRVAAAALVVAGFLHSFVRHADVDKIANLAQIVNVIAPILTRDDDMLIQSIFYPFEMFSKRRNGVALRFTLDGPSYEGAANGPVHYIDASAILDESKLHVFLTNRSVEETAEVCVALADASSVSCESADILSGLDAKAANSLDDREIVIAKPFEAINIEGGQALCELPPLSFAAITLNLR